MLLIRANPAFGNQSECGANLFPTHFSVLLRSASEGPRLGSSETSPHNVVIPIQYVYPQQLAIVRFFFWQPATLDVCLEGGCRLRQSFWMLGMDVKLLGLCVLGLRVAHGHQLAHDKILFLKPLLPAAQGIHLLGIQALEGIQRAVEVLGQHFLVEAAAGQAARGIPAGKVCVGASGSVKVAAGGDVEDAAAHGEIDGHVVQAIVGEQRGRGEGAEDGWRRGARERLGRRGLEAEIDEEAKEREKQQIDGGEDGGAATGLVWARNA